MRTTTTTIPKPSQSTITTKRRGKGGGGGGGLEAWRIGGEGGRHHRQLRQRQQHSGSQSVGLRLGLVRQVSGDSGRQRQVDRGRRQGRWDWNLECNAEGRDGRTDGRTEEGHLRSFIAVVIVRPFAADACVHAQCKNSAEKMETWRAIDDGIATDADGRQSRTRIAAARIP